MALFVRRLSSAVRATQRAALVRRGMNDGDRMLGDYPVLPMASSQARDPFKYWDKQDRRTHEEPMQEQDEVTGVWVYDYDPFISKWEALGSLLVAFGALATLYQVVKVFDPVSRKPVAPREFPFDNLHLELGGDPTQAAVAADAE